VAQQKVEEGKKELTGRKGALPKTKRKKAEKKKKHWKGGG